MAASKDADRHTGRERRRWSRYEVHGALPAALVIADRRIACLIENVSLTGARLRFAEPAPALQRLHLTYGPTSGPAGRCVWRTSDRLGVSFGLTEDSVDLALAGIRLAFPGTPPPAPARA